ncbi:MAG: PEP-CTERM sorting domain-containing protein [Sedimentisphaerales bacterium]|nr:PEP-CTERM sorting domain-containing protein [Sedimentisphaerales bacterium]
MFQKVSFSLLFVCLVISSSSAAVVTLDLFTLGCPQEYSWVTPNWSSSFDMGVTFVEINNVYIDWSGEITAELVVPCGSPPETPTQPLDSLFMATLYETEPHDYFGRAYVQGGAATSPAPEPFSLQSEFDEVDWSALLDGEASIEIWFGGISRPMWYCTVEPPEGKIDSAVLVIDGIIPEPSTLSLMFIGLLITRKRNRKKTGNPI